MARHCYNAADSLVENEQAVGAERFSHLEHPYSVNANLQLNSASHFSTPSSSVGQTQPFRPLRSYGYQGQEVASNDYNQLVSAPSFTQILDQSRHACRESCLISMVHLLMRLMRLIPNNQ